MNYILLGNNRVKCNYWTVDDVPFFCIIINFISLDCLNANDYSTFQLDNEISDLDYSQW